MNKETRNSEIISKYKNGATHSDLSAEYLLSSARIGQILQEAGLSSRDGGQYISSVRNHKLYLEKRERKHRSMYGCSYEQYKRLSKYVKVYTKQKNNAADRNVEWKFTFYEWCKIWSASGRLADRGRGKNKWVMARHGDVGPYSPDNVIIVRAVDNSHDGIIRAFENMGKRRPQRYYPAKHS